MPYWLCMCACVHVLVAEALFPSSSQTRTLLLSLVLPYFRHLKHSSRPYIQWSSH